MQLECNECVGDFEGFEGFEGPTEKPAASATTFLKPPHSSTPRTSRVLRTLKYSEFSRFQSTILSASLEQPNVAYEETRKDEQGSSMIKCVSEEQRAASAKCSWATSFATLAPFRTAQEMLSSVSMSCVPVRSEPVCLSISR